MASAPEIIFQTIPLWFSRVQICSISRSLRSHMTLNTRIEQDVFLKIFNLWSNEIMKATAGLNNHRGKNSFVNSQVL